IIQGRPGRPMTLPAISGINSRRPIAQLLDTPAVLTSLTIKNFTLVDHLDIEFAPGMTAITGETGAGKSLVLGALAMALGDRGDSDRIRAGPPGPWPRSEEHTSE